MKINKWQESDSVDPAVTVCHELPLNLFLNYLAKIVLDKLQAPGPA